MSKKDQKEDKKEQVERLKGEVRSLNKLIKKLKQDNENLLKLLDIKEKTLKDNIKDIRYCKCGGIMKRIDLGRMVIEVCADCKARNKINR